MFGYVTTDLPNLYVKDTVLYKAAYCGLCKSIGKVCGSRGRFLLNYDLTFLSVFIHNVLGVDFDIKKQHCILHVVTKRPVAVPDGVSKRVAALNVILAYHKLSDDVLDNGSGRIRRSLFKHAYKKAARAEPALDKIVKNGYAKLLEYEKKKIDSVDIAADPFASMMRELLKELLNDKFTEEIGELSYNLGKWIYLIDAVDDYDKDKKSGSFNVFVNAYGASDKKTFIDENKGDLQVIFGGILSGIRSNANKVSYKFNHDLTDNILFRGISEKTLNIMECKKCRNITKF